MSNKLNTALSESISGPAWDLTEELGEMAIETWAGNDSLLTKIPFLSTVRMVYKMGQSISEMHHLRQLNSFMISLHNGTAGDENISKHLSEFLKKDERARDKELEYIVLIISKYISEEKPRYLAKLYTAYVLGKINWEQFVTFSEMLDRFLPGDIHALAWGDKTNVADNEASDSILRLVALGLMTSVNQEGIIGKNTSSYTERYGVKDYRLTPIGTLLKNCLDVSREELLEKAIEEITVVRN